MQDEKLQFDVLIIGAGPAELIFTIELIKKNSCLDKSSLVYAYIH